MHSSTRHALLRNTLYKRTLNQICSFIMLIFMIVLYDIKAELDPELEGLHCLALVLISKDYYIMPGG